MFKKIKTKLGILVLAAASALSSNSGCSYVQNVDSFSGLDKLETNLSFDFLYYYSHLGKKIQTTPVHPDDAGFLTGETSTNVAGSGLEIVPRCGIRQPILNLEGIIKLKVGADCKFNLMGQAENGGIYDVRQQVSDIRPADQGSFVFTWVKPYILTLNPLVELEITPFENKNLKFGLEYGNTYTGFEVLSGHDRWGYWDPVQRESWSGHGHSFGIKFNWGENKYDKYQKFCTPADCDKATFIFLGKESYRNMEFAGEKAKIDAYSIYLGFEF